MEIFIGSSRESLDLVREIEVWLEEQGHQPIPWDKPGLFMPGDHTFNTLIGISRSAEGAVFIFSDDDRVWYRGDSASQPRDNVLIEYGLFAGALGPKKAIICRNGSLKHAADLLGINYIDVSEPRRARAKLELSMWARRLDSNPQDPEMLRLQVKIAELERDRENLSEKLSFESDKSKELGQLLTDQNIVDFANYDLSTDGHWKLLFEFSYFNSVTSYLAKSVTSPAELRRLLESAQSGEVAKQIAWHNPGDLTKKIEDLNPQRNIAVTRKAMRIFRYYAERQEYRHFLDNAPRPIQVAIEEIGESIVAELKLSRRGF